MQDGPWNACWSSSTVRGRDRTACMEWPGGLVGARKYVGDAGSGAPRGEDAMPFIETVDY